MTQIKICDSGQRRVSSTAGVETEIAPGDGDVAGAELTLNVEEITYSLGSQSDDTPTPNKYEGASGGTATEIFGVSEVDKTGIKIPVWTIRGVFDTTSSSDLKTFAKLVKMSKTKGYKYVTGAATANCWLNYVNYYDDYYAGVSKSTATTLGSLNVRIANFTVNAPPKTNYARWTLELRETS